MFSTQTSAVSPQALRLSTTARTVLRTTTIFPRRFRIQQQTRSFRFGLWSSYLDRNYDKELRRRHRIVKHKCIEAFNRKLSWDRHLPAHPKTYGFKSFMCSAWHNQDSRPGGRWVNIDELRTPREESAKQPSRTKDWEDLHLQLRRFKESINESFRVGSQTLRSYPLHRTEEELRPSQSTNRPSQAESHSHENSRGRVQAQESSPDPEYEIDPITNRKVYKTAPKSIEETSHDWTDIPVKTFRFYRSQFQGPTPASEEQSSGTYQGSASSNEPHNPVQEGLGEYDMKVDYYSHGAIYDVSNCGIDYNDPVQVGLNGYDDKISRIAYQMGLSGDKGAKLSQNHRKSAGTITESQDDVHRAIHHYEATVARPRGLLKAIQEYEAKRPSFPDSLFKKDEKTHPLIQAIQEFERGKVESKDKNISQEMLNPLLKSIHEYHKQLRLEKIMTERSGGVIDKQLADVLTPIEEYQRSLSQARSRSLSIEDGLKDHDSKVDYSRGRRDSILRLAGEEKTEDLDLLRASDIRAASGILKKPRAETEAEKSTKRKELETAFEVSHGHQVQSAEELAAFRRVKEIRNGPIETSTTSSIGTKESTPIQDIAALDSATSGNRRILTGNFVRDFPEEFETAWQEHDSGSLIPKSDPAQSSSKPTAATYAGKEGGPAGNPDASRIETSLDRAVRELSQKSSSVSEAKSGSNVVLQGKGIAETLEGNEDALTRDVRSIYEQKYGTIDAKHRQAPDARETSTHTMPDTIRDKVEHSEPTLYKILAYDPTMQSISEAETTSIVEDSSTPLTPAEVLLRLSNPTKFFPHFLPLQSQGYEIISGSGDVLVFRKVRPSGPPGTGRFETVAANGDVREYRNVRSSNSATPELSSQDRHSSDQTHRRTITNPIDGMQRNAFTTTGDFASPTGFVNHDLPRGSDPPYNIDVRREEPVFSGKSNWEGKSNEKPRRKGRGRKVFISAVWLAGCCYSVGVVTEFFRNGGPDSLQGF